MIGDIDLVITGDDIFNKDKNTLVEDVSLNDKDNIVIED